MRVYVLLHNRLLRERQRLSVLRFRQCQEPGRRRSNFPRLPDRLHPQARSLQKRFGKPKLKNLKQIAIDEIAIGRGHRYFTVVLDLLSGAVVYVGDGKGVDSLTLFWRRLRRSHAKVRAVATDMSRAYIRAVRDNIPTAVHVFDHFHVIKLFNEKLSNFRRELFREATADQRRSSKAHAGCS